MSKMNKFPLFSDVVKIQELEVKVQELECSCKEKDATITNLQGEIEKLNSELKSRSGDCYNFIISYYYQLLLWQFCPTIRGGFRIFHQGVYERHFLARGFAQFSKNVFFGSEQWWNFQHVLFLQPCVGLS